MQTMLLKNGRVIDPYHGVDGVRDLGVADGRIVDPTTLRDNPRVITLDLTGAVVAPGLIDVHVHLREPGYEYKETIATGTAAAAAGGFTTVVAMPNTRPPMDSVERIVELQARIDASARIRTFITGCLTCERAGQSLTDIRGFRQQPGVVALSDDGDCVQDYHLMKQAAQLAKDVDLPIMDHCEDHAVRAGGVMRAGAVAEAMRVPGMPGATESNMVARNIALCRETGARLHLQHLSYKESVRLLRQARQEGLPVTGEVSPHNLTLTHDLAPILGTNGKMNPPLGTEEDRQALIEAVVDGTITVIATDHAPHAPWEKARDWIAAPFGILGLETALPLTLTELHGKGRMDMLTLLSRFTIGPADLIRLPKDGLKPGAVADLVVFDISKPFALDITQTQSLSRNSPFHHRQVIGKVLATLFQGQWVYRLPSFGVDGIAPEFS